MALGVVSLGYGAAVAALVNRRLKRFGKLGYSLGVLAEVARLAPRAVRLALDGGERAGRSRSSCCAPATTSTSAAT